MAEIGEVVRNTLNLCGEKLKIIGIEVIHEQLEPLELLCKSTQISQVLLNLINNATDAIEKLDQKWIKIKIVKNTHLSEPFVEISVEDSGNGILPQTVAKMMQPFFTTKDIGKGTGLGLSVSKGILESHGGSLLYDSSSAHTRFVMRLPVRKI